MQEKPFEELFCICAQLVTKTWKEMRATVEDFDKVFDVVKEQIRRALDVIPKSFSAFQEKLNTLTFHEITLLRAQERSSREEGELQVSCSFQVASSANHFDFRFQLKLPIFLNSSRQNQSWN